MVTVLRPGGPIAQLSSLSFFLSALVSDVLLIRLCLVVANICLFTSESAAWSKAASAGHRLAIGWLQQGPSSTPLHCPMPRPLTPL
jgi:hypothetical protein